MEISITGLDELVQDIEKVIRLIKDPELITSELARYMRKFVHTRTGHLKSTIYYKHNIAGAKAPYAGYEEVRGGSHAFAKQAEQAFNMGRYADKIMEPL